MIRLLLAVAKAKPEKVIHSTQNEGKCLFAELNIIKYEV